VHVAGRRPLLAENANLLGGKVVVDPTNPIKVDGGWAKSAKLAG
jgi:predicted dinucleotide-binding enzyme